MLSTATDDGIIRRNPMPDQGRGTGEVARAAKLTIPQVYALAEVIDQRYRALVLLGTFGSLRWGGLAALRRCDIGLEACTVRVDWQLTEALGGALAPPQRRWFACGRW
jgi:hypothetical protein